MAKQFLAPRGTSDILPENIPSWRRIEEKARQLLETYGYREIRTPAFEETELFNRSLGQTSDVVQKQMLNLEKEGLSLRPEGTASIVRSYIENSLDKKEPISKLYYMGPMFRGERPQKGRLRQFHQIGLEAIGPQTTSVFLDAEVIALGHGLLKAFGVKDFRLKINTLGTSEDKENFSKKLREQLKTHTKELCEDCQGRFNRNVFRILDCKNKTCQAVVVKLDLSHSHLSGESQEYFKNLKEALNSLSISFEESPRLVRGLDYYTHTVFEIAGSSLGSQDALGAGGRYNNLVSDLGGSKVDAVGFALGIERILLSLEKREKEPSHFKVFIIALEEKFTPKAFSLLSKLRDKGIASDMSYKVSSVKSQMRLADRLKTPFVVILGEDEDKKGVVTLKNMQTGDQKEIAFENIEELAKNVQ